MFLQLWYLCRLWFLYIPYSSNFVNVKFAIPHFKIFKFFSNFQFPWTSTFYNIFFSRFNPLDFKTFFLINTLFFLSLCFKYFFFRTKLGPNYRDLMHPSIHPPARVFAISECFLRSFYIAALKFVHKAKCFYKTKNIPWYTLKLLLYIKNCYYKFMFRIRNILQNWFFFCIKQRHNMNIYLICNIFATGIICLQPTAEKLKVDDR